MEFVDLENVYLDTKFLILSGLEVDLQLTIGFTMVAIFKTTLSALMNLVEVAPIKYLKFR